MTTTRTHRFAALLAMIAIGSFASPAAATDVKQFLEQYCLRCHGEVKPQGDLSLHKLSEMSQKPADLEVWQRVVSQLESGEMPPADAKQPTSTEKLQVVASLEVTLAKAGFVVDSARRLSPSHGNALDHKLLFSGQPTGAASTTARPWRLTGQAYEAFFDRINREFGLGVRNYGADKLTAPWQLSMQRDFSDYASAHRVGEAELEFHLRNATKIAARIVERSKDRQVFTEMNALLTAGGSATPQQVESVVTATFARVLNRPITKDERTKYVEFLTKQTKELGAKKGAEQFLIAVLFHPDVIYRDESPAEGARRGPLPASVLARSIAHAITDREPDAPLLEAAAEGKLASREGVKEQVDRILRDRSIAKPRILRFFQEYFGYTTAGEVFKDQVTLEENGLKKQTYEPDHFISDTDRLIEWVLASDKHVLRELLTTPKTFVLTAGSKSGSGIKKYAEALREGKVQPRPDKQTKFGFPGSGVPDATLAIYEIDITVRDWTDEQPFEMPAAHRMGVLTHPSWLVAQSGNFDNHAIHRGRWIREKLLGGRVPDVPITVDAKLPEEPHHTLRERMRVTREEYCWKCHRQMDPLGLPFEQFDHFGRFRTTEQVLDAEATEKSTKQNKAGKAKIFAKAPLDTSGMVEHGGDHAIEGPVKDPFELIRKLASSEHVEQVFVRHAFRYFFGRNETLADGPTLVAAHRAYADSHGSMNALIGSLLTSDAFLTRSRPNESTK